MLEHVRRIEYAGLSIVTTDEVATSVLRYAAALAAVGRSAMITVPAIDTEGEPIEVEVVLGPASQIVSTTTSGVGDVDDARFLGELTRALDDLEAHSPPA